MRMNRMTMRAAAELLAAAAMACGSVASAQGERWTTYSISETGTSVEIPSSVFSRPAGHPDGYGDRLEKPDGSADLTVQSVPNDGTSPAAYLARKHPPADIVYKRVTPHFFVVSSYKRDKIWYDRCNFSERFVHCVLINYPAVEKQQWDGIVTRISNTLRGS